MGWGGPGGLRCWREAFLRACQEILSPAWPIESTHWLLSHSLLVLVPLTPLLLSFQLVPFELMNVDYAFFNFCVKGVFADGGASFLRKL